MLRSLKTAGLVIACASLVLASCGDDDDSGGAATQDTAANGAEGAASADACDEVYEEKVKIGWTPLLSFMPVHYALVAGYYEEEGLPNVEFVKFEGGSPAAAAMISGSIQFINTSGERPLLLAEEAGEQVRNVQAITVGSDIAVIAREGTGIEEGDVQSLAGKKIGITAPGGGFDKTLRALLKTNGLDPDNDLDIIGLGGTANAVAAMESGNVDAVTFSEPVTSQLLQTDEFFVAVRAIDAAPEVATLSWAGLQATEGFIDDNPCVVEKVVRAASRATNELSEDVPDAAVADAVEVFGGEIDEATLESALDKMGDFYDPVITDELAQGSIDGMVTEGAIPEGKYTPEDVYTDQFADAWEAG